MSNTEVKDFYNTKMPEKFGGDYEYERWHKNPIRETEYTLTKLAIERHVLSDETNEPVRIVELGPGAGTWTKLLLERFPDAYIDLVDISQEMLTRARGAIGDNERVRYIESDILEWSPEGKFDFFFSARVLEYIGDKPAFAEKIASLLLPGGRGFLITKTPHYTRDRFLGRKKTAFHQRQIAPAVIRDLLSDVGFIDIDCYPVTISVPLLNSALANRALGHLLAPYVIGPFGMFFAESYCVVFRKPRT